MSGGGPESRITGEDRLFELAGYLAACAAMALSGEREGSPRYSANRFIEALRRLIALQGHVEGLGEDPFLRRISERLENIRLEPEALQEILREFADEASRRLGHSRG